MAEQSTTTKPTAGAIAKYNALKSLIPASYDGEPGVYLNQIKEKLVGQKLGIPHMELFMFTAKRLGLDPLAGQIHAIARWDKNNNRYNMSIQTSIDGFRLIAQRSGNYAGQDDATFEVVEEFNPISDKLEKDLKATVTVYKMVEGVKCAVTASARWREYVQIDKEGKFMGLWGSKPKVMLGKVAEALALRKAFPNDLSGLYTSDEMGQADNVVGRSSSVPEKSQASEDALDGEIQEGAGADEQELRDWKLGYLDELLELTRGERSIEVVRQEVLSNHRIAHINVIKEEDLDELICVLEEKAGIKVDKN